MTCIFTSEVIMKVFAYGFAWCGEKSYILNPWNALDFTIVGASLISLTLPEGNLQIVKVFRMARLLRPLRVVSKNEGLKVSIMALFISLPAIINQLVIVILFFAIFAIVGVNLFKGSHEYCKTDGLSLSQTQIHTLINTQQDCLNYGGLWATLYTNFNDFGAGLNNIIFIS